MRKVFKKKKTFKQDFKHVHHTFPTPLSLGQFADCNYAAFVSLHMIGAK